MPIQLGCLAYIRSTYRVLFVLPSEELKLNSRMVRMQDIPRGMTLILKVHKEAERPGSAVQW
jgi:hypothetical protein